MPLFATVFTIFLLNSKKWKFFSNSQIFFQKQKLNFSISALFLMETRVCLNYFVNGYLWKNFFAFMSAQTTWNLISLTILVNLRPFTKFHPKIRAIKWQEIAKICLFWSLISLILGLNVLEGFRFTKIVKKLKFEHVSGKLEVKKLFQRQPFSKYLRLTLAFRWNSAL